MLRCGFKMKRRSLCSEWHLARSWGERAGRAGDPRSRSSGTLGAQRGHRLDARGAAGSSIIFPSHEVNKQD